MGGKLEKKRLQKSADAERVRTRIAREHNLADILKDAVVVKLKNEAGLYLFFSPEIDYMKMRDEIAYRLEIDGLTIKRPDSGGMIELVGPSRKKIYGVSVDDTKAEINDIVWHYGEDGELSHPHVQDLRPVSREQATQELLEIFAERARKRGLSI